MEKIHWSELLGNKFLDNPKPEMLTDDGLTIVKMCRVIGESKSGIKKLREVHYDRSWVKFWLKNNAVHTLPYNELQKLLKEVRDSEKTVH